MMAILPFQELSIRETSSTDASLSPFMLCNARAAPDNPSLSLFSKKKPEIIRNPRLRCGLLRTQAGKLSPA
jgi:hypothetical protein